MRQKVRNRQRGAPIASQRPVRVEVYFVGPNPYSGRPAVGLCPPAGAAARREVYQAQFSAIFDPLDQKFLRSKIAENGARGRI